MDEKIVNQLIEELIKLSFAEDIGDTASDKGSKAEAHLHSSHGEAGLIRVPAGDVFTHNNVAKAASQTAEAAEEDIQSKQAAGGVFRMKHRSPQKADQHTASRQQADGLTPKTIGQRRPHHGAEGVGEHDNGEGEGQVGICPSGE